MLQCLHTGQTSANQPGRGNFQDPHVNQLIDHSPIGVPSCETMPVYNYDCIYTTGQIPWL